MKGGTPRKEILKNKIAVRLNLGTVVLWTKWEHQHANMQTDNGNMLMFSTCTVCYLS